MIDGGTFQVGLTVMYFIVSLSNGVAFWPGWPVTMRVVHTVAPLLTTLRVKSGMLPTTWVLPRSRGSQRQRSMLARMTSAARSCFGPFRASTVAVVRVPVADRPRPSWTFLTPVASGLAHVGLPAPAATPT